MQSRFIHSQLSVQAIFTTAGLGGFCDAFPQALHHAFCFANPDAAIVGGRRFHTGDYSAC